MQSVIGKIYYRLKKRKLEVINILQILIQKGADIFTKNKEGDTALLVATEYVTRQNFATRKNREAYIKTFRVIDVLLQDKTDFNDRNNQGQGIFHKLVCFDKYIVEYLIKKGADVNARDNKGTSVLDALKSAYKMGDINEEDYESIKGLLVKDGARGKKGRFR